MYDGNTNVLSGAGFSDDRVSGDVLTFSYSKAFIDKNVGTNKNVNFTTIAISGGADQNNYTLVTLSGTAQANITKKDISGIFTASNKIYDGNNTAIITGRSLVGNVVTDIISLSGGTATFASVNVGTWTVTSSGMSLTGTDASNYNLTSVAAASAKITKAEQTITWSNPAAITYGTTLSATQLNASVTGVTGGSPTGEVNYSPASGTLLNAGPAQNLKVDVAATLNYNAATKTVQINVDRANQIITWSNPANTTYGTLLSATQLNATVAGSATIGASAPGAITYTPASGTLLNAGSQTLQVDAAANSNYNAAFKQVTLVVNKKALTVTANNIFGIQYSDVVPAFTAAITGFISTETLASSGVRGLPSFTTTASLTVNRAALSGPGNYNIVPAIGSLASSNYLFSSFVNGTLAIAQEQATVEYTGSEFASTGTATATTATIRLSAKITDAADGYPGDIRNATVTFIITPYDCMSMAPGAPITVTGSAVALINAGDPTVGTFFKDYTFDIGTCNAKIFDVQVVVGNYYTGTIAATVSVAKSLNDFITGGGHLNFGAGAANTSCGTYKSEDGSKTNFGFNVKYNKTGTNLQGNVNIIIRNGGQVYQAKGTVGGSNGLLSVNVSDPANKRAVLTAKASLVNTATGLAVPYGSSASMELRMNDKGEPGVNDTYIIKIWGSNNELLYSSSCSDAEIKMDGGNIQVSSTITGLPTTTTLVSSPNTSNTGNPVTFTATVSRGLSTVIPSGIVTFKEGTTTLGTGAVSLVGTVYKATFTTSALAAGSHPIIAVYSGDASFNSSTSPILTQTVTTAMARVNTNVISAPKVELVAGTSQPLMLRAYPNPSTSYFNLAITGSIDNPVTVRVFDVRGRVVQAVQKITPPATLRLGDRWTNGTYFVEVIQGNERKLLKVIKAN